MTAAATRASHEPRNEPTREARPTCARCLRPEVVCYCAHITAIETKTRVVLLQHPREEYRAIGTARMASLCLPSSELHVGVEFGQSKALARALSDVERPPVLLYPGDDAIDVLRSPPPGPVTLVVVDGTWAQTRKLVRQNPVLAALPRVAFYPPTPSEYRIRREPSAECVSTIEALMHVLGALEGDAPRFQALLAPFRAMVDAQLACQAAFHGARARSKKRVPKSLRDRMPSLLAERARDLVCVVAEANAWPYASDGRRMHPDELIQWSARRLRSGETFDFVCAPHAPLSPSTPSHTGLSRQSIEGGGSRDELFARWGDFLRDDDLVGVWGHYGAGLFVAHGGSLGDAVVDLRAASRTLVKDKVGTLDEFAARIGAPAAPCAVPGRAGLRLGQLTAIAEHFVSVLS